MRELPPKQRPTQPQTTRKAGVQTNTAGAERAPRPKSAPNAANAPVPRQGSQRRSGPAQEAPVQSMRRSGGTSRQSAPRQQNQYRQPQPQYRQARYRQAPPRRDPYPLVIGGIIGALVVGLVIVVLLLGNNNNGSAGNVPNNRGNVGGAATVPVVVNPTVGSAQAGNLPGTAVPDEGKNHVPDGQPITYQSYPPSSGSHYGTPATYGFTEKELAEGNLIHSLEHGAVVLYYKPDVAQSVKDSLRQAYDKLPPYKYGKVKLIITAYSNPKMQTPMAMTSWGRVQPLTEFNYDQISAFYQGTVGKGPEDVP